VDTIKRLSEQLGIPCSEFSGYGESAQTRTDHLREVAAYAGWRAMNAAQWTG